MRHSLTFAIAGSLLVFGAAAHATSFDDGIFGHGWYDAKVVDTTAGSLATYSAQQLSTGGNPTHHREVTHSYGFGAIVVAHWKSAFTYDPSSSGGLSSLNYSFDLIHKQPPGGQAVAYRLLVRQGGVDFVGPIHGIFPAVWQTFSGTGLTATSFNNLLANGATGTLNPDFGSTGSPLTFGYISANSNPNSGTTSVRISGIDNYHVGIVPEPGTIAALAVGISAVVARRRRRRSV
ncbi:MAG TPA: PEP-CTERM sorting domain-containing protein [Fimbriimonadaceae bacterium]|nr:PEP-CTERM sorting domain-containing protein [Fimbriimonadaceae bacterium]